MTLHPQLPQAPETTSDEPHPAVHRAAAALLIWFVVAAWLLFGGSGYIDLALAMVSVLVFMMIAIPTALWRVKAPSFDVSNKNRAAGETQPLSAWLQNDVAIHSGREKGSAAATEILLPIAAIALGITALGIAFDLVRVGAL
jgi:hypothetical protein